MRYITDSSKKQVIEASPGTVILFHAPVGAGKTSFCLNELWRHCRINQKTMLLLVNRSALKGQLRQLILKRMKVPAGVLQEEGILKVDGLIVTSYQYLQEILKYHLDCESLRVGDIRSKEFDFVIADEAHYLLADSVFSMQTGYLRRLPEVFPTAVRVYMSATLAPVRKLLLDIEHVQDLYEQCTSDLERKQLPFRYRQTGMQNLIIRMEVDRKRDVLEIEAAEAYFSYFKSVLFGEDEDLVALIENNCGNPGKWLCFVDSKEKGREYKKRLIEKGITAAFVAADGMEEDDERELNLIMKQGRFQVQILLATPVIDNGVSITDGSVTHLVISGYEVIQAVQQAGRLRVKNRKSPLELYICRHSIGFFNRRMYPLREKMKAVRLLKQGDEQVIAKYLFDKGNAAINGLAYIGRDGRLYLNPLAEEALEYSLEELRENIKALNADPDGYIKRVLSWFGLFYEDHLDLSDQRMREGMDILQVFLVESQRCPMAGESWDVFRKDFRMKYESATGKRMCSGRADRLPGVSKLSEILRDFGYSLDGKHKVYTIVREEE